MPSATSSAGRPLIVSTRTSDGKRSERRGGAHRAADAVAGDELAALDLRGRDVDVVVGRAPAAPRRRKPEPLASSSTTPSTCAPRRALAGLARPRLGARAARATRRRATRPRRRRPRRGRGRGHGRRGGRGGRGSAPRRRPRVGLRARRAAARPRAASASASSSAPSPSRRRPTWRATIASTGRPCADGGSRRCRARWRSRADRRAGSPPARSGPGRRAWVLLRDDRWAPAALASAAGDPVQPGSGLVRREPVADSARGVSPVARRRRARGRRAARRAPR